MAIGDSTWQISAGGGSIRATSAQLARAVVHFGFSPLLPPNTLLQVGSDTNSLLAALDYSPLAELAAFTGRSGLVKYVVALNPSTMGGLAANTTLNGTGSGTVTFAAAPHRGITVLCVLGGPLGTAQFKFSLDGGNTYGPVFTSSGSPWVQLVSGTFCQLSFAAATYVTNKTLNVSTTGVVTPGTGWAGVVTQTSSPLDNFEPVITILTGGPLATASVSVSMDNGNSTEIGQLLTPSGGVFAIPNTGVYVTMVGTFNKGDTYSTLATGPSCSTTDMTNAANVTMQNPTVQATLLHNSLMPASAAAAFSAASTLESSVELAFSSYAKDWQAICDCPSNKGGTRITSPITGRKLQRGASWLWVDRYVDTDPKMELAAKAAQGDAQQGAFRAFLPAGSSGIAGLGDIVLSAGNAIRDAADADSTITGARGADLNRTAVCVSGRDEFLNPGLDSAQINTFRTYNGPLAIYGTITSGVAGFKMLTTNASYADGAAVRVLDVGVAGLRPLAEDELGQDYATNLDGTIAASAKAILDTKFDTAFKLLLGMAKGGDFSQPQASSVSAQVLASSQLGTAPKTLQIAYQLQPRGKVTNVQNALTLSGTLTVTQ
jgi:hypothetical protein